MELLLELPALLPPTAAERSLRRNPKLLAPKLSLFLMPNQRSAILKLRKPTNWLQLKLLPLPLTFSLRMLLLLHTKVSSLAMPPDPPNEFKAYLDTSKILLDYGKNVGLPKINHFLEVFGFSELLAPKSGRFQNRPISRISSIFIAPERHFANCK